MSSLKLLSLLATILTSSSWAGGLVTIAGRLVSITATQYVVETKSSTYHIKKSAISPSEAKKITRTEIPVSFAVPFEAILAVQSNPNATGK